ncbi:murein biosynthesis integral membrane protein MurJ [Stenotrophobium rhamnosiphilum]|uniref:Probable lipid II flippase MurJ n=1 Tax=Stenotrophobium rhamnosiphilum TaxID=2029166 RepID=A0A2T5MI28_9GAMM|nr:murein biosynthesis integral membrane protein MurJ [Stenotrophobium rhamnosiphilum]PTU32232.1 murein biosynthesis integral membrane protein MurJ [Stenotrophobium rhamnosiphilum]
MASSLLKSSGIVSVMTLLSRVLGFVRDVMLAVAFGAGGGMDAFLIALKIPNFGRRMFAEGAFSQAFVPVFTETKTKQSHEEVRDLVSVVMGTLGGVLSVVTLIGCLGAPLLLYVFAPGFSASADPVKHQLGTEMLRWTFPYLMFISLTAMCGGVLNSYGRFAIPAFTPVLLNVCLIASAFIDANSVRVLAYAVFVAGIVQFLFQLPQMRKLDLLPRPRWAWRDSRVRRILALMIPVMIGSSVSQISLLVDSAIASLMGDGPVSWLYFADRLMEFPLGIFSIAVGTVILPALAVQHAKNSTGDFSRILDWGLRTMLVIGVPAMLGLILLAGPLVTTLFGYGKFTDRDVEMSTYALWAYAPAFMGFSLVKVLIPGFYARQETRIPVRYGVIALISGSVLSVSLYGLSLIYHWEAAHAGLALATSFSACVNSTLLYRRLRADSIYLPAPDWRKFWLRLFVASAAMVAVTVLLNAPLADWLALSTKLRVIKLLEVVSAAGLVYFGVLIAMGMRLNDFRRH